MSNVIVIGGGASGMVSAYFASKNNNVILIEQNEKLGKKLYITGKGRCNLTNYCELDEFLSNVVSNPKFLMSSINGFTPKQTYNFFEELGLKLKVERGNRVFPLSDKSSDVIKTLQNALVKENVDIKLNEKVLSVCVVDDKIKKVTTDKGSYLAESVIIATGGISYKSTGATGDGYKFAKTFGHTVTSLAPSLCGINLKGEDYKSLQGLTLKNVSLKAVENNKAYYFEQGELLFTHYGISGPLVLTCSALSSRKNLQNVTFFIDLKPAMTIQELDKRVIRDFSINNKKELKNALDGLLPKAIIPLVISRSNIPPYKKTNDITSIERSNLVSVLKNLEFKPIDLRGYEEAVITSGGVSVKEINPKTMESKLIKGVYFVGEVLDVDAFTGGFNLQIAFSTAKSAGVSIKNSEELC